MEDNMENLVDCYNCSGANVHLQCGLPMLGCNLCETHGNGFGKMHKDFRHKEVIIIKNNTEHKFTPPPYECVWCKDEQNKKFTLWDNDFESNATDGGMHRMPRITALCNQCCKEKHKESYKSAKKEYDECKEKYLSAKDDYSKYFYKGDIPNALTYYT